MLGLDPILCILWIDSVHSRPTKDAGSKVPVQSAANITGWFSNRRLEIGRGCLS
jgi:hypothetical protein